MTLTSGFHFGLSPNAKVLLTKTAVPLKARQNSQPQLHPANLYHTYNIQAQSLYEINKHFSKNPQPQTFMILTIIKTPLTNWLDAAKAAPFTHALATMAIAAFTACEILEIQNQARHILGIHQDKPYSLLTHAIAHTDIPHLVKNIIELEVLGPFVERKLGKSLYIPAILITATTGAYLCIALSPEQWTLNQSPIGMRA